MDYSGLLFGLDEAVEGFFLEVINIYNQFCLSKAD